MRLAIDEKNFTVKSSKSLENKINANMFQMGLLSWKLFKNSIKMVWFIMCFEKIKYQVKKGNMPYPS